MDILGEEFLKLINTFEKNQLKYIIVGGFATYYHGYHRTTGDIDFWLKDNLENREKLVESLDQMQYGRMDELLRVPFIAGYCEVMLDNGVYADFMNSILGFEQEDFDESYIRASVTEINGISIRFLHMNDLIKSKESSDREKDVDDAEQLKKIKENNS